MGLVVEFSSTKSRKRVVSRWLKKVTSSFPDEKAEEDSDYNLERWWQSKTSLMTDDTSFSSLSIKTDLQDFKSSSNRANGNVERDQLPKLIYVSTKRRNTDATSISLDDYSFQSNLPF